MSAADTAQAQAAEAIGLLQFGDQTRVPQDAFIIPVAWPVTAWRVLVPESRRTGSDPLQRAVLRIVGAGCIDPHAIASWLDVPSDLVRVLLAMFATEGFIEASEPTRLSDAGRRLLKEDDEITFSDRSHHTGWVLRDDWSGDIVPFLIEDDLRWCNRDSRAAYTVLQAGRLVSERPQPLRIRQALSEYRRYVNQTRNFEHVSDSSDIKTEPEGATQPIVDQEDRPIPGIVQILWEKSERVYVPMWLYFTADDPKVCQIATGFPLAPLDRWFKAKLNWTIGRTSELRNQIDDWTAQALALFPLSPTLDETDTRAVTEFPFLATRQELIDTRALLARTYRAGALYHDNFENLDVYLTRCCSTLEALLTACLAASPNAFQAVRMIRDDSFVEQLRDISASLNLELPAGFCNPFLKEKARKAVRGKGENPRDRTIALIYCAKYDLRSPARDAFKQCGDLLVHIDTVTRYRNTHGGHYDASARSEGQNAMAAQVERSMRKVIGVLGQAFFGEKGNGEKQI
jgi:hypothetical protein